MPPDYRDDRKDPTAMRNAIADTRKGDWWDLDGHRWKVVMGALSGMMVAFALPLAILSPLSAGAHNPILASVAQWLIAAAAFLNLGNFLSGWDGSTAREAYTGFLVGCGVAGLSLVAVFLLAFAA